MLFYWGSSHILQASRGDVRINGMTLPKGERIVLHHHDHVSIDGCDSRFMAPRAISHRALAAERSRYPTQAILSYRAREYALDPMQAFSIGTDQECELRVAPEPGVEQWHCRLFWDMGCWWLQDLGSREGTQLDGVHVGLSALSDLQHSIAVGSNTLSVSTMRSGQSSTDEGAEIVSASPSFRAVVAAIKRAANLGLNVLVQGEAGTGKDLLAHTYHAEYQVETTPFIVVNCAMADPESLRGTLLGANDGLSDHARGGTIFFDELTNLSLEAQRALVPILIDLSRRALNAVRARPGTRIIAASSRDVALLHQRGLVDSSFYQNLGARIEVPPLRQRPEDIIGIARKIIGTHPSPLELSRWGRDALLRHSWPRNVRELQGTLLRALSPAPENGIIDAVDLDIAMHGARMGVEATPPE